MMMKKLSLTILLPLLLSGCGSLTKSDYQRPMLSVPAEWRVQDTGSGYLQHTDHWWDNFEDPQLSMLIGRALTSNNDLAIAGIQLQQARLAAGLTDTNLTPDVSVTGSANNNKNLRNNTTPTESYSTTLSLSYELDLWGKLARAREQAQWQVEATEQDRQNTALTLIGNTAQYYWQIASLNQKIKQQQAGLEISQQTLALVQSRYASGAAGQLDLLQAKQSLLNRENTYRTLQQQREENRNALAILFNRSPTDRQAERSSLDINQDVPIAKVLPVEVIARRPDVKAAEGRLRAALAGSDVERLSFYPSLSLAASLGSASSIFSQWFSNPVRTLGANAALPFVQWNTVQLTIEKSDLDVKQAAIVFRSQVYNALADVDNAMSQRLSYQQQKINQQQNLQLSQQRLVLARSQYQAGAVSFQSLLDAEDDLLTIETNLSDLQYNYLNATMKLWLALGGGVEKDSDITG
ncbi:efflux transporter outer membrane subunit [Serratia fonticola]|jgi:NodT family efflux transporter outer membrane factor (OMF) lipoprotein|uniref:efflux transporter outer membrane subunit n=2 Tax=Serratia fonticola TaxID=47917 RepID=UPI00042A731E|nr:efflux transporter outer membrane subunit [Serratia fonticola]CAI1553661.1 Cation efflux system protein CusC precursor [Serratia fonticola]CAI1642699.1 Cation efflux system protein CusC precursor [Serratia fonticola]